MNIGIIGGGCSGSLVAVHLLRSPSPLAVHLIEPRSNLARGLAYSTACPDHLLNVPAGNMSAFRSHPSQFHEWLRANWSPEAGPDSFAPRQVYGKYLECLLRAAVKSRPECFRSYSSEALDVDLASPQAIHLTLRDLTSLALDRVVLAIGNPAPKSLPVSGLEAAHGRYYRSAWESGALECPHADQPVLLIGSGLTAVDALVALRSGGHRGVVYMVSRHGQLPHPHACYQPGCPEAVVQPGTRLSAAVRAVRAAVRRAPDWRTVIDGLRPVSNQIWSCLTVAERSRFLRHLKVYWDVHRHRMAPQIAAVLCTAEQSGGLEVVAGRLRQVGARGECLTVEITLRGGHTRTIAVGRIVNCTGPNCDYRRVDSPLMQSLFHQAQVSPCELGTGLLTNEHGAVIDQAGRPSARLFAIGPLRSGGLFETVALPEIRVQAEALAAHLLAG
jgi:uncharacterized NAD(P)/FAD-binding protein YdhS